MPSRSSRRQGRRHSASAATPSRGATRRSSLHLHAPVYVPLAERAAARPRTELRPGAPAYVPLAERVAPVEYVPAPPPTPPAAAATAKREERGELVDYLESKEDAKELKDAPEGQEELYKRLRTTLAEFNAMNRKDPVFRLFEFYGEREESLGWAYLKAEEYEYKKKYGHETNEERRRRQSLERQARDLEDARRAFLVKLYEKKKRYIDFVTGKILLRINGPCKHNQNAAIHGFPAGCALHREGACPFIHRDQKKFWQDLHKIPEKMWEKETKAYSKKVSELRAHARDVVRSLEFCGRRVDGPRLEHPDHVVVKPTGVPESVVREHRERYAQQRRVQEQSYLTAPGQGRRARARHNTAARRAFHTSELDVDEMHEAAAAVAAHEHGTRR